MDLDSSRFRVVDNYAIESGDGGYYVADLYFYPTLGVGQPVITSYTASGGFTMKLNHLQAPLYVTLLHTPDKCEVYPLEEFLDNSGDILGAATDDMFEYYWQLENNWFKRLLRGEIMELHISPRAVVPIAYILTLPIVTITGIDGRCVKQDIIELWRHGEEWAEPITIDGKLVITFPDDSCAEISVMEN